MNFTPRGERPHLIFLVSAIEAVADEAGLIHYYDKFTNKQGTACRAERRIWTVPMQTITCLACLGLKVKFHEAW